MDAWLVAQGCTDVVMGNTACIGSRSTTFWKGNVEIWLVNARQAKQVSGRKIDGKSRNIRCGFPPRAPRGGQPRRRRPSDESPAIHRGQTGSSAGRRWPAL